MSTKRGGMTVSPARPGGHRKGVNPRYFTERAEYATANNSGKTDKGISNQTARAVEQCNGHNWTPVMEDAVLTGRATKSVPTWEAESRRTVRSTVSIISRRAIHQSHGNHYDRIVTVATRTSIVIPRGDIVEADAWSRSMDRVSA